MSGFHLKRIDIVLNIAMLHIITWSRCSAVHSQFESLKLMNILEHRMIVSNVRLLA